MGRPPLSRVEDDATVKTTLRYPESLKKRIEAVAGKRRVADFFRETAEAEVARRERATKRKSEPET